MIDEEINSKRALLLNSSFERLMLQSAVNYALNNDEILDFTLKFLDPDVQRYIEIVNILNKNNPYVSKNSLKLSYKIYKNTGKLFIPFYFRTYYGHWQKSSGACSGLLYWYNDKIKPEYSKDKIYEYMAFERLSDLLKPHTHIIIQEPTLYNSFEAEIWSEDD